MERLAMILAKRLIELDPAVVPRLLLEAAILHRQSSSRDEQQQLLDFQASVCALTGRPPIAAEPGVAVAPAWDAETN